MEYRPWSEEDREQLMQYIEEELDVSEIAEMLDRTEGSVAFEADRLKLEGSVRGRTATATSPTKCSTQRKTAVEEAAVEFLDRRLGTSSRKKTWEAVVGFQNELRKVKIEQPVAHMRIQTNKWIGIAFQGDLHLGNMATDYKQLLNDKELIQNNDNVYLVINGDYCDNYIAGSHTGGAFEALFPPAVQKDLAKDYIESVKDKVLALVAGCHDLWSLKIDDFDLTEYLSKHGNAVYLGSGGDLYLQVGNIEYKIKMRHKYRFNSSDNATHTVKKMFEKEGGFDVGCIAHNHIAAMEESIKEGLDGQHKRIFLRSGSYKTTDRYSSQMGFSGAMAGVPIVLFNPLERQMRGFQDLEEGIDYLKYLNCEK
jgi:hypothetical protein